MGEINSHETGHADRRRSILGGIARAGGMALMFMGSKK
jgi:hypothetical protein